MPLRSKYATALCVTVVSFGLAYISGTEGILNNRSEIHSELHAVPKSLPSLSSVSTEGHPGYVTQFDKVVRSRPKSIPQKRQLPLSSTEASLGACECMDYWECVSKNGHIYSYCGISDSEVCCFHNRKAKTNSKPTPETYRSTTLPTSLKIFTGSNNNAEIVSATSANDTSLQDVDYFVSLEDGVGTLKQITRLDKSQNENATGRALDNQVPPCGTQTVEWKFDSKADFKEWPWHVAFLEINSDLYICGGTLIARDLVITAAHCVQSYSLRRHAQLKVRAGEYDVSTNAEPEPFIEVIVDKIFVYPDFNNATLVHDIALVKLRRPLNYTGNVRPACLTATFSPPREEPREYCVVNGWGRANETSVFSLVMKEIVVPLWRSKQCEEKLKGNFGAWYKLSETAVCAGERGHDACDGDGGGGLICYESQKQQFYLRGVTSFGIGCGRLDTPGVYTEVRPYLDWINSHR